MALKVKGKKSKKKSKKKKKKETEEEEGEEKKESGLTVQEVFDIIEGNLQRATNALNLLRKA